MKMGVLRKERRKEKKIDIAVLLVEESFFLISLKTSVYSLVKILLYTHFLNLIRRETSSNMVTRGVKMM
jgi:hypothetical protein